jgi:hypothetical protein
MGKLWEFVRYKDSFHEYLYGFTREAQQTPSNFTGTVRKLLGVLSEKKP